MAGHSKFKNIQFRKGAQDKKRSKLFSKLSRDITLAAKTGLPDPSANARLRLAIANAKAESMPKDNIDRALKKAFGGEADLMEEIRYEGFGPGGVGLIIETLTDNRNRSAANLRAIFTKRGGALGESGSVSFMFDRLGEITYPLSAGSADEVMDEAIEAGAEDVVTDSAPEDEEGAPLHTVYAAFEDMNTVAEALEVKLGPARSTAVIWRPRALVPVTGETAAALAKLLDALDDDDDVQTVFGNYEINEEDLIKLAG
jgi:YebC/PmpR family DNA-binding regulatory protein